MKQRASVERALKSIGRALKAARANIRVAGEVSTDSIQERIDSWPSPDHENGNWDEARHRTSEDAPYVQHYKYHDWPEHSEWERDMEFRLTYKGKLPAVSKSARGTRVEEKHRIRQALHPQLRELWKSDQILRDHFMELKDNGRLRFEALADNYARCGYRFLPLVGGLADGESCSLDILFLRRDQPGSLVTHGGDIDNRVKVVLDALRMPDGCHEVCGNTPTVDEEPFFCLLTDDNLITELKIVTDRLLTPLQADEYIHDVHLIIHVKTISSLSFAKLL